MGTERGREKEKDGNFTPQLFIAEAFLYQLESKVIASILICKQLHQCSLICIGIYSEEDEKSSWYHYITHIHAHIHTHAYIHTHTYTHTQRMTQLIGEMITSVVCAI